MVFVVLIRFKLFVKVKPSSRYKRIVPLFGLRETKEVLQTFSKNIIYTSLIPTYYSTYFNRDSTQVRGYFLPEGPRTTFLEVDANHN